MYEAFEKLSPEKKKHIIEVCIEEFAANGYKNTSTNTITERAGISKGILFHYFKNKKNLYLYIIEHTANYLTEIVLKKLEAVTTEDFFDRIKELSILKLNILIPYRKECQLVISAFAQKELKQELSDLYKKFYQTSLEIGQFTLFNYLDPSLIRETISKEKTIEVIMALFEHLSQKYLKLYQDNPTELLDNPEPLLQELDLYIDIIKHGIMSKKHNQNID